MSKSMEAHTILTLGNRNQEGFSWEKNDCTVRAFSLAANIPYKDAHLLLGKYGRKPKKGTHFLGFIKSQLNDFGYILTQGRTTPAQFVKNHPKGRFVCQINRHVFAVIDGKIHDGAVIKAKKRLNYFVEFFV